MKETLHGNREDLIRVINNTVIGFKAARNRGILIDHFVDGMTYEAVAEKYGISDRQAKRVALENMKLVRKELT